MSTQGPLKAGLCAYHGRGGAGTRAFKPQIAERTRQRKWAALRKFVCKSEDALKRKKKQALARSSRVWEKLCHFFHCWLQKRKKETTLRLFTRRRPERIKQVFFFLGFLLLGRTESGVDVSYVWMTQKLGFEVHVTFTCKNTHKERMRAQTWSWTSLMKSFCSKRLS